MVPKAVYFFLYFFFLRLALADFFICHFLHRSIFFCSLNWCIKIVPGEPDRYVCTYMKKLHFLTYLQKYGVRINKSVSVIPHYSPWLLWCSHPRLLLLLLGSDAGRLWGRQDRPSARPHCRQWRHTTLNVNVFMGEVLSQIPKPTVIALSTQC